MTSSPSFTVMESIHADEVALILTSTFGWILPLAFTLWITLWRVTFSVSTFIALVLSRSILATINNTKSVPTPPKIIHFFFLVNFFLATMCSHYYSNSESSVPNKPFRLACSIKASYFIRIKDERALTTDTCASKTSRIVVDPSE